MAGANGHVILLLGVGQVHRQIQRRPCLADARNIVALTFDGQQRRAGDLARIGDAAAMFELAGGQGLALEHQIDRLQIEFGGHVANGAIFVIERLAGIGGFFVAIHQMLEHFPVRFHVVGKIHRHEA